MKKHLKPDTDKKRLIKYFRVFFAIVIVIALTVSFALYTYTERVIRAETENNNSSSFEILKTLHDMQFKQIEKSMHVLCNNPRFTYFMNDYDELNMSNLMCAVEDLNSIKASSDMIEDICIYYPSRGYTLSYKQTVSKVEMRHDKDFILLLKDQAQFAGYRTYVRNVTYPFSTQSSTVVTLVKSQSIRSASHKVDALVIVDLSFTPIYSSFVKTITENDSSLLIYAADGTLISSVGQVYPYDALTDEGVIVEEMRSEVRSINGVDYSVYSTGMPSLGWTYFYVQSNLTMSNKLSSARNVVLGVFVVCVLIGLLYSWLLAKHLLKPLENISEHLGSNDVDIYERIDRMIEQNEAMNNSLQENLITGRNSQMLHRMLMGINNDSEAEEGQPLNLRNGETECAFYLFNPDAEKQVSVSQINQMLAPFGMRLIVKLYTGVQEVALLVAARAFDDINMVESAAMLKGLLGGDEISVGISRPFSSSAGLNDAYAQANTALGMYMVRGDGVICSFKDIRNHASATYPYKIENALLRAFKAGDRAAITGNVREFEKYLCDNDAALQQVYENYVQLFCTCQRLAMEIPGGRTEVIGTFSHRELTGMKSLADMSAYIISILESLLDASAPAEKKNEIIERVCAYIDAHLTDAPSIETLASEFFMSASTLRSEFSKDMGMSIKAYTDMRRVQVAKELLADTDIKIQDIAKKIGFYYAQSFIPFFKNATGQTPGEFRQEAHKRKIMGSDTPQADE